MAFTRAFDPTDGSGFGIVAVLEPEHRSFFQSENVRTATFLRKPEFVASASKPCFPIDSFPRS